MTERKTHYIKFAIVGAVLFFLGFGIGTTKIVSDFVESDDGNVDISRVIDLYSRTRSADVSFDQFWEVWNTIKKKYVSQPVDDVDLFYGAISGVVWGLDDPYSVYFPPPEAEEFAKDLSGEFDGIGAEIGIRQGQLIVIAPLSGSPAERAGLASGDIILAINKEDTSDMTLDQAVLNIRGKKGTSVVLTITRNGFDTREDVSIVRDTINTPTVAWEMKEDNIAYLRIGYFNETTWNEFDHAVTELLSASPRGIVLDLRSNPGGFLDTSIAVASEWVERGIVVKERYSDSRVKTYESIGKHRLVGMPTIVLVDGWTASGSEIVAGALQDYGLATLVGTQTFGKGSVQDLNVFADGSALKLTIAKWFTPKDRQIDEEGIAPDVIVEQMFSESNGDDENMRDFGLEKAVEILFNQ